MKNRKSQKKLKIKKYLSQKKGGVSQTESYDSLDEPSQQEIEHAETSPQISSISPSAENESSEASVPEDRDASDVNEHEEDLVLSPRNTNPGNKDDKDVDFIENKSSIITSLREEGLRNLNTVLNDYFHFDPEIFKEILIRNNAILAGGSVLSACTVSSLSSVLPEDDADYERDQFFTGTDLDVYVNLRHAQQFYSDIISYLKMNPSNHEDSVYQITSHMSSGYDMSFFVKNRILGRVNIEGSPQGYEEGDSFEMDIMIVADEIDVKDVANNFDLSFCEIYYDGHDIYSENFEHIYKRQGILKPDYVASFLEGNIFIKERISKYKKRGFDIQINLTTTININPPPYKDYKKITNKETWLVKRLMQDISDILNLDLSEEKRSITGSCKSFRKNLNHVAVTNNCFTYVLGNKLKADTNNFSIQSPFIFILEEINKNYTLDNLVKVISIFYKNKTLNHLMPIKLKKDVTFISLEPGVYTELSPESDETENIKTILSGETGFIISPPRENTAELRTVQFSCVSPLASIFQISDIESTTYKNRGAYDYQNRQIKVEDEEESCIFKVNVENIELDEIGMLKYLALGKSIYGNAVSIYYIPQHSSVETDVRQQRVNIDIGLHISNWKREKFNNEEEIMKNYICEKLGINIEQLGVIYDIYKRKYIELHHTTFYPVNTKSLLDIFYLRKEQVTESMRTSRNDEGGGYPNPLFPSSMGKINYLVGQLDYYIKHKDILKPFIDEDFHPEDKDVFSLGNMLNIHDLRYIMKLPKIKNENDLLKDDCTDVLMFDTENIEEWLNNDDNNFILIKPAVSQNDNTEIFGLHLDQLLSSISEETSIFYECSGRMDNEGNRTMNRATIDINRPYMKFTIDYSNDSGSLGLISMEIINTVIFNINNYKTRKSKGENVPLMLKCFILLPKMLYADEQMNISHTISYENVLGYHPDLLSANHCQRGSNYLVYTIISYSDLEKVPKLYEEAEND